jgi:hypothetical protein
MATLREKLADWTSRDGAMFEIAANLGIVHESWINNKALLWKTGPIDELLTALLQNMVKARYLEYREEPDQQYRWKP